MPTWDAKQYLQFERERTQPCRDLCGRVELDSSQNVIDLGCGPGNSTAVLAERWPEAELVGLDTSVIMIDAARAAGPAGDWRVSDIAAWAEGPTAGELYDVVFSNAALQWVPDHARLLPAIWRHVAPGGAMAVQVPANLDAPAHEIMRMLAASPAWRPFFAEPVREWFVHPDAFYYDALAPLADRIDLWATEYVHVLPGPAAIVDWYRGTGLRPFLDALAADADLARFAADYERRIAEAYPARPDGRVLFPFRRLFVVAYRAA